MKEGRTNYLVLEYRGGEYLRFYHLVRQLFRTLHIESYHIYQGKYEETVQVKPLSLEEADEALKKISDALKEKLGKNGKPFPPLPCLKITTSLRFRTRNSKYKHV